jgi:hypothetical protein
VRRSNSRGYIFAGFAVVVKPPGFRKLGRVRLARRPAWRSCGRRAIGPTIFYSISFFLTFSPPTPSCPLAVAIQSRDPPTAGPTPPPRRPDPSQSPAHVKARPVGEGKSTHPPKPSCLRRPGRTRRALPCPAAGLTHITHRPPATG